MWERGDFIFHNIVDYLTKPCFDLQPRSVKNFAINLDTTRPAGIKIWNELQDSGHDKDFGLLEF